MSGKNLIFDDKKINKSNFYRNKRLFKIDDIDVNKIKLYGDKVNTNFQGKKIPKENASFKCLSLIMLDSVIRVNKNCCPQTLLEECKYEIKKNEM